MPYAHATSISMVFFILVVAYGSGVARGRAVVLQGSFRGVAKLRLYLKIWRGKKYF